MILIALAIKLYDGGPVFYKQPRLTKDKQIFMILKFRSMKMDSEVKGAQLAKKEDDRITPVSYTHLLLSIGYIDEDNLEEYRQKVSRLS